MVSLIDICEVLQLTVAEMTQSPAKPGIATFDREVVETLLDKITVLGGQRTQKRF